MDKILHVLVGMILAANPVLEPGPAFATAVAAGVLKEIYDKKHPAKHSSDPRDALATVLGAGIVFTIRIDF
jgi:hypothetical protein